MALTIPQVVIVYTAKHGEVKAYDTTYSSEQMDDALERCRNEHGHDCHPRAMDARQWPPEYLRRLSR